MKRLKLFRVFESEENFTDALNFIEDYKTEISDLGYDVSKVDTTTYPINENNYIKCLRFSIGTPLDTQLMLDDCYDSLLELQEQLQSQFELDLSVEIYEDLPIFDLDTAIELYGGLEWSYLEFYIHKPIDREEIEI
jgi:hypothetical protein